MLPRGRGRGGRGNGAPSGVGSLTRGRDSNGVGRGFGSRGRGTGARKASPLSQQVATDSSDSDGPGKSISRPSGFGVAREDGWSSKQSNLTDYFATLKKSREKERAHAVANNLVDDANKQRRLEDAITFTGTCPDMCPEFERVERIVQKAVDGCEKTAGPDGLEVARQELMVKRFRRSAAGDEAQLPSDVRPPPILKKTLDYLIQDIVGGPKPLSRTHAFLWDRTRSIRNDFTIQNVQGAKTADLLVAIDCYERIARFHIHSLHTFARPDMEDQGFTAHNEREQLNKTLLSLMEFYDLCALRKLTSEHEAEFRAYNIIMHFHDQDIEREAMILGMRRPDLFHHPRLRTALELYAAAGNTNDLHGPLKPTGNNSIAQNNCGKFFRLIKSTRVAYTMACVAEIHFNHIRKNALMAIRTGYRSPATMQDCTLRHVTDMLGFDNEDQTWAFCEACGLELDEGKDGEPYLVLNSGAEDLDDPSSALGQPFSQSLVEFKRHGRTLPAVINGLTVRQARAAGAISSDVTPPVSAAPVLAAAAPMALTAPTFQPFGAAPTTTGAPSVAPVATMTPLALHPFGSAQSGASSFGKPSFASTAPGQPASNPFAKPAAAPQANPFAQPAPATETKPPAPSGSFTFGGPSTISAALGANQQLGFGVTAATAAPAGIAAPQSNTFGFGRPSGFGTGAVSGGSSYPFGAPGQPSTEDSAASSKDTSGTVSSPAKAVSFGSHAGFLAPLKPLSPAASAPLNLDPSTTAPPAALTPLPSFNFGSMNTPQPVPSTSPGTGLNPTAPTFSFPAANTPPSVLAVAEPSVLSAKEGTMTASPAPFQFGSPASQAPSKSSFPSSFSPPGASDAKTSTPESRAPRNPMFISGDSDEDKDEAMSTKQAMSNPMPLPSILKRPSSRNETIPSTGTSQGQPTRQMFGSPAVSIAPAKPNPPPVKVPRPVPDQVTRWLVSGEGGLLDNFIEFIIPDLVQAAYEEYDEQMAVEFRQRKLQERYFYRWKYAAQRRGMRERGRRSRQRMSLLISQQQSKKRKGDDDTSLFLQSTTSRAFLEPPPAHPGSSHHQRSKTVPNVSSLFQTNPAQNSPPQQSPPLRGSPQSSLRRTKKSRGSTASSTSSMRSSSYLSGKSLLSPSVLFHARSAIGKPLPVRDTIRSDYWRLKAAGLQTLANGVTVPTSAEQTETGIRRKRALDEDEEEEVSPPSRPRSIKRLTPSFSKSHSHSMSPPPRPVRLTSTMPGMNGHVHRSSFNHIPASAPASAPQRPPPPPFKSEPVNTLSTNESVITLDDSDEEGPAANANANAKQEADVVILDSDSDDASPPTVSSRRTATALAHADALEEKDDDDDAEGDEDDDESLFAKLHALQKAMEDGIDFYREEASRDHSVSASVSASVDGGRRERDKEMEEMRKMGRGRDRGREKGRERETGEEKRRRKRDQRDHDDASSSSSPWGARTAAMAASGRSLFS
ncbi:MAG: hypothetical protein M1838_002312 [Thelocarpon superellum]|nr:MAG: hypothetical protein M1838_002312 [Thelocarpon superellum]